MKLVLAVLVILLSLYVLGSKFYTLASNCPATDYDCQIKEIQAEIDALKPAHEQNEKELADLRKQINSIKSRLANIDSQLSALAKSIAAREEDLELQKQLLEIRVSNLYVRSRVYSPLIVFLAANSAAEFTRELVIREQITAEDRRVIGSLADELIKLNQDKETLKNAQASLTKTKTQLDQQAGFLAKEVEKVGSYLSTLSSRQNELLALKAGGFSASIGDTPPTLEPCSGPPGSSAFCDPGFRAAFAAFSFGAPHRKGMSQFGAFGRSKAGQSYQQILQSYYGDVEIRKVGMPAQINTTVGALAFEGRYLRGIAEMPTKWADEGGYEALKAQAVAARSYALAYVGWRIGNPSAGGKICVTEACQVYKNSKADSPGRWAEAVSQTEGEVLVSKASGEIVNAFYASTAGGYTFSYASIGHNTPGLWDTSDGKGGWPDQSWEKKAGSPWFYKAWFKTRSGASCGKANPWLTSEELADILNAWRVLAGAGGDVSRVSPITTSCFSGNPYSLSDLQNIGGFNSVSDVSVVYGNDGSTQTVGFTTNKGQVGVPAEEFKKAFNLRAPGYIGIKSSLFNIVKL
ncbi:hypothetical protein HY404_02555 [Candidatus Microgenomates bacterium]|nr:hypothetical protein [Candidatus Microgenomates bacterium]